jgi:hypothetical protein
MKLTPQQVTEAINEISDESFTLHQELATLNARMGGEWLVIRATCETNGECDRKLGATKDGQRAEYLKWYLKGLAHKRTALLEESKNNRGSSW